MNKQYLIIGSVFVFFIGGFYFISKSNVNINAIISNVIKKEEDHSKHPMDHKKGSEHSHQGIIEELYVKSSIITNPTVIKANEEVKLSFLLQQKNELPITNLINHHSRKLHVVIISEDLDVFGHIHPEDFQSLESNDFYSVMFKFPRAGRYLVAIDGMTKGGRFSDNFIVYVEGSPKQGAIYKSDTRTKSLNGNIEDRTDAFTKPIVFSNLEGGKYEITMNAPHHIMRGEETALTFSFMRNHVPLNNLVPYLDAPMHFAIVKEDLSGFVHEHGNWNDNPSSTATIELKITFKSSGKYRVIGQFKNENMIITAPFTVEVM